MRITDRLACSLTGACAAAVLATSATAAPSVADASPTSKSTTPTVSMPPAGQHGFPFMSTVVNLAGFGYVEEEFLIAGRAQAYVPTVSGDLPANGRWNAMPNPGVTAPYSTRILVRRPRDPARFNGVVVVEWINESGPTEATSDWLYLHEELLSRGYAYVGVSAQYHSIQVLQGWESGAGARYAKLFHPGDSFDYNIFAQAGSAVEHPREGDPRPLGNLTDHIRTLLATGFSQSAFFLVTYVNSVHRLTPVYDGFLLHDGGVDENLSISTADDSGDPVPAGVPATPDVVTPYPFQLRGDQHVPVLIMQSEFGLSDFGSGAARTFHLQPDTPNIRIWEFTGAPHIEADYIRDVTAETNKSQPGQTIDSCNGPPFMPALVHGYGLRAALHALWNWAENGRIPSSAPRMSLIIPTPVDDFNQLVAFDRDPQTNLTRGGIRLPAVAVPIATLDGNRSDLEDDAQGPGGGCYFAGAYDPWDHDSDSWDGHAGLDPSPDPEPELLTLYPTHSDYVWRITGASARSVETGYLLPEDAAKIVLESLKTPVP
jgi:hypothetical protein